MKDNLVLVDVGASGGAHRRWNHFSSHLTAYLFEPDDAASKRLNQRFNDNIQVINAAVLGEKGEHPFNICQKQEVSSIFKPDPAVVNLYPNPERYEIVDTQLVTTTSLDQHFLHGALPAPHFIKLDTQGSELLILQGGSGTLQHVVGVEIEFWHVPVYQDAPLFPEIDGFLQTSGFRRHDIVHYFWKRTVPGTVFDSSLGDMICGEALYFRPPESLLELVSRNAFSLGQAVCCYLAYGYTHLSRVLVNLAVTQGVVNAGQAKESAQLIQRFQKSKGLSRIPGADLASWRLSHLTERLLPKSGWVSKSKAELGSLHGTL